MISSCTVYSFSWWKILGFFLVNFNSFLYLYHQLAEGNYLEQICKSFSVTGRPHLCATQWRTGGTCAVLCTVYMYESRPYTPVKIQYDKYLRVLRYDKVRTRLVLPPGGMLSARGNWKINNFKRNLWILLIWIFIISTIFNNFFIIYFSLWLLITFINTLNRHQRTHFYIKPAMQPTQSFLRLPSLWDGS